MKQFQIRSFQIKFPALIQQLVLVSVLSTTTSAFAEVKLIISKTNNTDSIGMSSLVRLKVTKSSDPAPRKLLVVKTTGTDSIPLQQIVSLSFTPALQVLNPLEGESFKVGDTLVFQWLIDFDRVSGGVYMSVSPNGGINWVDLNMNGTIKEGNAAYSGNRGTWRWVIPATINKSSSQTLSMISSACLIKVQDYAAPGTNFGVSGIFAIVNH